MTYNKYQSEWARARQAKNEKIMTIAIAIVFLGCLMASARVDYLMFFAK